MANSIPMPGCRPEPLMAYLKALGVFRIVAEQKDSAAKLSWNGGVAALTGEFDRGQLESFLLREYKPTPILAPWNGGSGFHGGGREPLDAIASSQAVRLTLYRDTIRVMRDLLAKPPKGEEKAGLLARCRNSVADDVVPWLDACFVLSESGPGYFPLLGTGGNDGRLDFTNNFMQRLRDAIPFDEGEPTEESKALLAAALFADSLVPLGRSAIGQFDPGGIGGANATQGKFEAGSRVNPWDFVLMVEGTLLFAGSVARRAAASGGSKAAFPFTVESVAVGYGSASVTEETTDESRAELWLPLWTEPMTFAEVQYLFAEGRAQLGRRQARNAVEFALAASLLGVSRGVTSFARYGFLKRNGLAFLAAPLGRITVQLRPRARLLEDPALSGWMDALRRACRDKDKTPVRYQTALREIDRAMYSFANRSEQGRDAAYLLDVLAALGRAERVLANGLAFSKEKYLRPLQGLNPQWIEQADDGTAEFRLAASFAAIKRTPKGEVGPARVFLEEVEASKFATWSPGSTSAVWSAVALAANLAAVFRRRQMESFREGLARVPLDSPRPAPLNDVIAFLNRETDDVRLQDLIWGLIGIDSPADARPPEAADSPIPYEFAVPRLLTQAHRFVGRLTLKRAFWKLDAGEPNAKPDPDVFHILLSGRRDSVEQCVTRAARRLAEGGLLVNGYRNRQRTGMPLTMSLTTSPERLLAAMSFPLSDQDIERLANSVLYPPERED